MKIIKILSLAILSIGATATTIEAQETALNPSDNAKTIAMIKEAFGSVTLKNIAPPTQNIQIQFPTTTPQTQPTATTTISKGSSWSQLPIGAFTGVGSGGNESMVTLAQKIYPTTIEVQTAVQGALSNFRFLEKVPVKQLVAAFPQLANVAINSEQVGSWGACGAGTVQIRFQPMSALLFLSLKPECTTFPMATLPISSTSKTHRQLAFH
jgi:hypothetical protein